MFPTMSNFFSAKQASVCPMPIKVDDPMHIDMDYEDLDMHEFFAMLRYLDDEAVLQLVTNTASICYPSERNQLADDLVTYDQVISRIVNDDTASFESKCDQVCVVRQLLIAKYPAEQTMAFEINRLTDKLLAFFKFQAAAEDPMDVDAEQAPMDVDDVEMVDADVDMLDV